jgi:hypothetical protein
MHLFNAEAGIFPPFQKKVKLKARLNSDQSLGLGKNTGHFLPTLELKQYGFGKTDVSINIIPPDCIT